MQKEVSHLNFTEALSEKYLSYALSTITSRSLPDVRDGLKPVHRRLLYAMRQLNLNPSEGYKKSARVVGDVMGKFHPHGDVAIYESMVRLAQEFALRYPLVDGQGNFGNIDGDNAAAMRYTEAKMTKVSSYLLDGINENAVDFKKTYDGEDEEPLILPAGFPNLLANGSQGIAVGMATSIPPHNINEICEAAIHLINNKNATVKDLLNIIKGPDLPTGGIIVENKESIFSSYMTGRGSFRLRARWKKEKINKKWIIVITEIPYQVQKTKLLEKLVELIDSKKLPLISSVSDESAEDIRIIIEPKNSKINPEILMESLFKFSDLETKISLNMNVLDSAGRPNLMNLKQVLEEWLDHRKIVLLRRKKFNLEKINLRILTLRGFLVVFLNLDKVLDIIRYSEEPKIDLIKTFKLTSFQADAILEMKLRSLRKFEEKKIKQELLQLEKEKQNIIDLTNNESLQWNEIKNQIISINFSFLKFDKRRTSFEKNSTINDNSIHNYTEKEPLTIVCSKEGWIRSLKGFQSLESEYKFKEGDKTEFVLHAYNNSKIMIFLSNGNFYTLDANKIPGGKGVGEPLSILIDIKNNFKTVFIGLYKECNFLIASNSGHGFIINSKNCLALTKGGKRVLYLNSGADAIGCVEADGDKVALIGSNKRLLIINASEIPKLSKGKGVILQRYNESNLSDIKFFYEKYGLSWRTNNGKYKKEKNLSLWYAKRGALGKPSPPSLAKRLKF